MNALADYVELIYNKLVFFKALKLTMVIAIIIFIIYIVYTIVHISTFVDFWLLVRLFNFFFVSFVINVYSYF